MSSSLSSDFASAVPLLPSLPSLFSLTEKCYFYPDMPVFLMRAQHASLGQHTDPFLVESHTHRHTHNWTGQREVVLGKLGVASRVESVLGD